MWGHPDLGVLLIYVKSRGAAGETYHSKGDVTKLDLWVETLHGDLMPVGLYIPFRKAWPAVKEFLETEVNYRRPSNGSRIRICRPAPSPTRHGRSEVEATKQGRSRGDIA